MKRLLTTTLLGFTLLTSPVLALDLSNLSDEERNSLQSEIRDYILKNPEVLVEAMDVLEQRRADEQSQNDVSLINEHADAIFNDKASWVGGNPDGDITVVEFMDYRCGYCRRAYSEVSELVKSDGKIRFVVKEFPILGDASDRSARFAIATLQTAGNDAYESVHDALIALKSDPTDDALHSIAKDLGLDADAIIAAMNSDAVSKVITDNHELAQSLSISGTPTFIMPDAMLRGYVPLDGMRQLVADARSAKK